MWWNDHHLPLHCLIAETHHHRRYPRIVRSTQNHLQNCLQNFVSTWSQIFVCVFACLCDLLRIFHWIHPHIIWAVWLVARQLWHPLVLLFVFESAAQCQTVNERSQKNTKMYNCHRLTTFLLKICTFPYIIRIPIDQNLFCRTRDGLFPFWNTHELAEIESNLVYFLF